MSILSDRSIKQAEDLKDKVLKPLVIYPNLEDQQRQPASIDVTLDSGFLLPKNTWKRHFAWFARFKCFRNFLCTTEWERAYCSKDEPFILYPGQFALACTRQYIKIPDYLMGFIEGKSSWGRRGVFVHVTASILHPGYEGAPTLELFNASSFPVLLYPDIPIGQVRFETLATRCERPYGHSDLGSKYQSDIGTRASKGVK